MAQRRDAIGWRIGAATLLFRSYGFGRWRSLVEAGPAACRARLAAIPHPIVFLTRVFDRSVLLSDDRLTLMSTDDEAIAREKILLGANEAAQREIALASIRALRPESTWYRNWLWLTLADGTEEAVPLATRGELAALLEAIEQLRAATSI